MAQDLPNHRSRQEQDLVLSLALFFSLQTLAVGAKNTNSIFAITTFKLEGHNVHEEKNQPHP